MKATNKTNQSDVIYINTRTVLKTDLDELKISMQSRLINLLSTQSLKNLLNFLCDFYTFEGIHLAKAMNENKIPALSYKEINTLKEFIKNNELIDTTVPSYNDHNENCRCEDCIEFINDYNSRNNTTYVA